MNEIAQISQENLTFRSTPQISATLPGRYYFEPTIFAQEKEKIFFKWWQLFGYACDLREPGSYITGMLLDQPLVAIRGKDGKLRAFYNVCRHRGHLLLDGKGKIAKVRCPFHAWNYDLTGKLVSVPNAENVAFFDRGEFPMLEIRIEEFAHMVFVNLDLEAQSLNSLAGGLAEEFRATIPNFDKLNWIRRDRYEFGANWKFVLDGLECYHCPYIHPGVMGSKNDYMTQSFDSTDHEFYSTHIIRTNKEVMLGKRGNTPYEIRPDPDIKDTHIWFLYPNIIFVAHVGDSNLKVGHAWPVGPDRTIRFVDQFTATDPPTDNDLACMQRHREVFLEDIAAMEAQQKGVQARGYTQGRLMVDTEHSWQSEHGTHHFDNLVWRALNGANY